VEVTDDGHGGADEAIGSGLVGLRDRVEGVDGWMHLSSPIGGPTTLLVELPCAS
jgi:signal transduction histidine kinase